METNVEIQTQQNNGIVTMGEWVVTILLCGIPLVNLIMLFVWAFGSSTKISKKNFAKAQLIFVGIAILLMIIFWGSIVALLANSPSSL